MCEDSVGLGDAEGLSAIVPGLTSRSRRYCRDGEASGGKIGLEILLSVSGMMAEAISTARFALQGALMD